MIPAQPAARQEVGRGSGLVRGVVETGEVESEDDVWYQG